MFVKVNENVNKRYSKDTTTLHQPNVHTIIKQPYVHSAAPQSR